MTRTVRAPQTSPTQELPVRPTATVREPEDARDSNEEVRRFIIPSPDTKKVDAANISEMHCSTGAFRSAQ
uniref:Uncharacterized protein n=1 Tax=Oryza punctata TaxID=4537 RepID=A0A0E0LKZ3_ORYPU